jgi:hypothetical protein
MFLIQRLLQSAGNLKCSVSPGEDNTVLTRTSIITLSQVEDSQLKGGGEVPSWLPPETKGLTHAFSKNLGLFKTKAHPS